jgi:hypothetical protein
MGKYSSVRRAPQKPRNRDVHPVMRGIGCIMIVVVPILAYGISVLLVNYGTAQGWPISPNLYGIPSIPPLLWRLQGLRPILQFIQAQNNLEAYLFFTIVITLVIGVLMSIIYGYMYSIFGPPKYGPQDEPPIRKKVKPYKR